MSRWSHLASLRFGLRARILLFTVLPLVALAFMALWMVHRRVSSQVQSGLRDDLRRASAVLEHVLEQRLRTLSIAGQVIVRDPKFFSTLTIPGDHDDHQLRATVAGVARDFNATTDAELFEVLAPDGTPLASVGSVHSDAASRRALVQEALQGGAATGILVLATGPHQATVHSAVAGGRVVGALLLGAHVGTPVAEQLRGLTRSEVSFLSRGVSLGSTLADPADRRMLAQLVGRRPAGIEGGAIFELGERRRTSLTLVRQLPGSAPAQDQLYAMQRSLEAETAFLREIDAGLLELGLLAVVIAALAGIAISHRITSPVQRLVRGAEEMERGNYDYPLDIVGRDEIGYLARRFQDMRQKQRAYVHNLQQVVRLKSEFISVASHELRTPLSIVSGFHELLAGERLGTLNADQRHALEAIGGGIATLSRIAEDATRVAQVEHDRLDLEYAPCDVASLIHEAVAGVRAQGAQRVIDVAVEVAPGLGSVLLDGRRIGEALGGLVANAIRFTPDGGRVDVRALRDDRDLVIEVADTGVGIAPDRQAQLFEPGSVTRDSRHHHSSNALEFRSAGLGLGLSIARGIVEAHGGEIRVHSQVGRGSTFTMRVPFAPAVEHREAA